ncbi:hypothetical protein NA78x_005382 [Anatilimnocola sp. NA78]|uniref:hypothetical protein n=1 Tax=Anatilimnocola sp. NA78 TaxID=3415683 RepID=UPI003CE59530
MMLAQVPRRLLLLAAVGCLAFMATGCSPAQQVVGTWDLDSSKPIPTEFFDANPLVGAMLAMGKPDFQVTMQGDGAFHLKAKVGPVTQEKKGSWRFVKTEGKTLLLMVKEAGKTEETELRFTPLDAEHADLSMPLDLGGQKINPAFSFIKAKPGV